MSGEPQTNGFANVSVILPLYNGRRHVMSAVQSVLDQSLLPSELIVVDDGSADDGAALLQSISAPFTVTVVRQPNAGQSAARNHGVQVGTQPYIAFIDQDDQWLPDHLAVMVSAVSHHARVAWVYGDFDEIDGDGRTVTKRFLREHGVPNPKTTLHGCVSRDLMVIPSASLLRRDAFLDVGGFDEELSGYEDDDLFIRMFRAGHEHHFVDTTVTRFRIHAGSSSDDGRFIASRMRFASKLRDTIKDDARFRRYYYRDIIVPRLFQQSLDDYVRFVSAGKWEAAIAARQSMNVFARHRPDYWRKRWKLMLMQNPRIVRIGLQVQEFLPARLGFSKNPAMRLR